MSKQKREDRRNKKAYKSARKFLGSRDWVWNEDRQRYYKGEFCILFPYDNEGYYMKVSIPDYIQYTFLIVPKTLRKDYKCAFTEIKKELKNVIKFVRKENA